MLTALGTDEQSTAIYLQVNGQVKKTLAIPHRDFWVVDMLERLADNSDESKDVQYWSNEMKTKPDNLVNALDYLIGQGFLERTT